MPTVRTTRSVMWFRRDLRLSDHPALNAAVEAADEVVPLFVVDPALWRPAGELRREYLRRSLAALDESIRSHQSGSVSAKRSGGLVVRVGDPVTEVRRLVREVDANAVHVSADFGPYGKRRDDEVEKVLAELDVHLERTGTPYAVAPGRVVKGDGTPYRVYSPFYRAWLAHGWRSPAPKPTSITWASGVPSQSLPVVLAHRADSPPKRDQASFSELPPAGEAAALRRWAEFAEERLTDYAESRDRPDLDRTSRLSVHLKFGEIHPRTLLADLTRPDLRQPDLHSARTDPHQKLSKSHEVFRKELAWREFYADVLHHSPGSAREYMRTEFAAMPYDDGPNADARLTAWQYGQTGYPIVDAGMRQLLREGWMHNRVRMIVASFLVKDLHLEWQRGARWFMQRLVDGDLASNSHGWQWTAGCGTDAAPFFRIFNPITQGKRFDPDGRYVRRYIAELSHVTGSAVHEPWTIEDGYEHEYPRPIVDHAEERSESLARYELIRQALRPAEQPPRTTREGARGT